MRAPGDLIKHLVRRSALLHERIQPGLLRVLPEQRRFFMAGGIGARTGDHNLVGAHHETPETMLIPRIGRHVELAAQVSRYGQLLVAEADVRNYLARAQGGSAEDLLRDFLKRYRASRATA